jgi:hypothetical protein
MKKLIPKLEQAPIQPHQWFAGVSAIIFIRFLLELISSPPPLGILTFEGHLHHYLGFIFMALAFAMCTALFVPSKTIAILRLTLFALTVIWVAPVIDWVATLGKGSEIQYLFDTPQGLWKSFLTFFGHLTTIGVTLGVRVEILLILAAIFYYVRLQTKSVFKAVGAVILSYIVAFAYFALPSLLALASGVVSCADMTLHTREQWFFMISQFSLLNPNFYYLYPSLSVLAASFTILSLAYYLMLFLVACVLIALHDRAKFYSLIKEKFPQSFCYWLMMIVGATCAVFFFPVENALNFSNFFYIVAFVLLFAFAHLLARHFSSKKYSFLFLFAFAGTMIGGLVMGSSFMILLLAFLSARWMHNAPSMAFNKIPVVRFFFTFIANLAACLFGYLAFSTDKHINQLPFYLLIPIALIFAIPRRHVS